MKHTIIILLAAAAVYSHIQSSALSQEAGKNVKLHVNTRWRECSFQLDPSLTQEAWHKFTAEAGLVAYFRPLADAKPMGVGNYELSILKWETAFDDTDPAWNNTFVHPDSTHWLKEGDRLPFPGLAFRTGITDRIDVGAYLTIRPGANYGFWAGQVQYNVMNDPENDLAVSARGSIASLIGPDDLDFTIVGLDLLASKKYSIWSDWFAISPYAGVSTYLANSHETTTAVNLSDEHILGVQGMVGVATQISLARVSVEYNVAKITTLSLKAGIAF
jgi:hypothetical protein